jgi:hypothetical protein
LAPATIPVTEGKYTPKTVQKLGGSYDLSTVLWKVDVTKFFLNTFPEKVNNVHLLALILTLCWEVRTIISDETELLLVLGREEGADEEVRLRHDERDQQAQLDL